MMSVGSGSSTGMNPYGGVPTVEKPKELDQSQITTGVPAIVVNDSAGGKSNVGMKQEGFGNGIDIKG